MYIETGLGQPRKKGAKLPQKDIPTSVSVQWKLNVPFRKDFEAFRQEVVKAIGKHVAAREKTKIDPALNEKYSRQLLTKYHTFYSQSALGLRESDIVVVGVVLVFMNLNHTGLTDVRIDPVAVLPEKFW
jgi:hypothetical protein